MWWLAAAVIVGFLVTFVFSGLLHLPRRWFVLAHLVVTGGFVIAFMRSSGITFRGLIAHNWRRGALWTVPFGLFAAMKVFGAPPSPHATGWQLAFDILWSGFLYATLDTLLLSVVPVLAVSRGLAQLGPDRFPRWTLWVGALTASAIITAAYHAGFPEYTALDIAGAVWGNTVLTAGFLLSTSAITPIAAHWIVHVAALIHGPATTSLLPPH